MRSTTSRRWSDRDNDYIKANIEKGAKVLAEYFGVTDTALRKRCSVIGISSSTREQKEPKEPKRKADNSEKFNPNQHKIKNNSTEGKIPFYIKSEKMTVYLSPENNNDTHKQKLIEKFANRHKNISK